MQRTIHNPILKDTVTFVRTSAESGGEVTELEAVVMAGASSPPHFHMTYDETITVLEGSILIQLAKGREVELGAGQARLIKAGQVHGLRNATGAEVRLRSRIAPGSQGFEDALRIMYGLASDGLYNKHRRPRSFQHVAICASISDTRLTGSMAMLNPLITLVAGYARWRGVEEQLKRKYCV
jgi:quercetin dioxygenase-like cupin family protein